MKIQGKTIAVTGAGSGLGRELVLNMLLKGAKVAAIDIDEKGLTQTLELAGQNKNHTKAYVVDVADKDKVEALPAQIIADFGALDGLINNAGVIQPFVRINDLEYQAIERVLNINFFGALYMTKSFLPHLLKRKEAHIVNVSSMGGFLPVPGQTIYGASKAALKLFTEGLYSELLDTNVHVTIVLPGGMDTNIMTNSGVEMSASMKEQAKNSSAQTLSAEKAAEMVIGGMEKDKFRILVGSDARFMDFIYRLAPKFATKFIFKKMKALLS